MALRPDRPSDLPSLAIHNLTVRGECRGNAPSGSGVVRGEVVRIYGLLSWYDERQDWLAAAVTSAAKLCDGIIAVDGAYALFPDSLRHPTSGAEQAATILETALA